MDRGETGVGPTQPIAVCTQADLPSFIRCLSEGGLNQTFVTQSDIYPASRPRQRGREGGRDGEREGGRGGDTRRSKETRRDRHVRAKRESATHHITP
mmetsp:Transcript_45788/g.113789  ORF Transcript_45788/g.113789 Transcript_45788/m.113789 type:complete len:97 (-) Transcript_45788:2281-2571(-)